MTRLRSCFVSPACIGRDLEHTSTQLEARIETLCCIRESPAGSGSSSRGTSSSSNVSLDGADASLRSRGRNSIGDSSLHRLSFRSSRTFGSLLQDRCLWSPLPRGLTKEGLDYRSFSVAPSAEASQVAPAEDTKTRSEGRKNVLDIKQDSSAAKSGGALDLNPPRGTRDWYPDEMRLRNWLFGHFRDVGREFGFEEWDAPVLESEDLYVRKAGEEITQQLYNFEDKGGRRVALRPELTPSLARMVLAKGKGLALPVKWGTVGQCWRYERTTRGRKREHYQWNLDIWGVPGVEAEAEILAALVALFRRLGLGPDDIGIRVSNRKLLQAVLDQLHVPASDFAAVCVLLDKLEKVPRDAIAGELAALGLTTEIADQLLATMSLRSLDDLAAVLGDDSAPVQDLRRLFELAGHYGYGDWLVFDSSIIRGLAYYTGTVFEGFDRGASLRAVCGGGRYDRLLSSLAGGAADVDVPACGFGMGDVVIVELLKDKGLLPNLTHQIDDVVFAFDESLRGPAVQLATRLRGAGRAVDIILDNKKIKWAMKHADRVSAQRIVILGSQEWAKGVVKVKTLADGTEAEVAFDAIV